LPSSDLGLAVPASPARQVIVEMLEWEFTGVKLCDRCSLTYKDIRWNNLTASVET
jgi:hypothetical protein